MSNSTRVTNDTQRSYDVEALAIYDAARLVAENTPCDFDGCNGAGHEVFTSSEEWAHDTVHSFGDHAIELTVSRDSGSVVVTSRICMESYGPMTAAELRGMADDYAAFPAWLQSMADELDRRNSQ